MCQKLTGVLFLQGDQRRIEERVTFRKVLEGVGIRDTIRLCECPADMQIDVCVNAVRLQLSQEPFEFVEVFGVQVTCIG